MDLKMGVLVEGLETKLAPSALDGLRSDVDGGIGPDVRPQARNRGLEVNRHDVFFKKLRSLARVGRRFRHEIANGAARVDVGDGDGVAAVVDDQGVVGKVLDEVIAELEVDTAIGAFVAFGGQRVRGRELVDMVWQGC